MTEMPNIPSSHPDEEHSPVSSPLPIDPRASRAGGHGGDLPSSGNGETTPKVKSELADGRDSTSRRGRKGIAAMAVFCCLILALYGGGVLIFSRTCYPNTVIADADLSWLDRDSAIARVRDVAKDYALTVEGNGFTWSYEAQRASDIIDASAAVDRILSQNEPLLWPMRIAERLADTPGEEPRGQNTVAKPSNRLPQIEDIQLPESFDRDTFLKGLNAAIDEFNATRTGAFDAASSYDPQAGKFTLQKANSNRKINAEAIDRSALMAVSALNSRVELTDEDFAPLAGGADERDLQKAIDAANDLTSVDVDLKMGGASVATLDRGTLATWVTFDEALTPSLSTDSLRQWVRDLASTQLDTSGSERTYTRPDGKAVTVRGGSYGWISDEEELTRLLQDAISNRQTGEIEVPVKRTAAKWGGAGKPDWGAYCDIDLTEQHARYYDAAGNLVWESGCITGNPNKGNSTPTGIFTLNSKARNITLVGLDEDDDGEPDYRTPVTYWMPFVGGAIGMHDANWQSAASFSNPNAYTWTGSHGCVNLPPERAEALFQLIAVGDCVIVHP